MHIIIVMDTVKVINIVDALTLTVAVQITGLQSGIGRLENKRR